MFSTLSACAPVSPDDSPPPDAPGAPVDGGEVSIARASGLTKAFVSQKSVSPDAAEATDTATQRVLSSVTDARRVRAYIQSMKELVRPQATA